MPVLNMDSIYAVLMATVHARYETRRSVSDAFAAVTRWEDHRVPLTTIRRTDAGFTARTGVGPLGFDDPMTIGHWEPPRSVELHKTGRVIAGWARIRVDPTESGSVVTWSESVRLRGVPAWCDPLLRPPLRAMIRIILRRLLG